MLYGAPEAYKFLNMFFCSKLLQRISSSNNSELPHSRSIKLSMHPLPKSVSGICSNIHRYFYPKMHHILIIYDQVAVQYNINNRFQRTVVIYKCLKYTYFKKWFILKYNKYVNKKWLIGQIFQFILAFGQEHFLPEIYWLYTLWNEKSAWDYRLYLY